MYESWSDSIRAEGRLTWPMVRKILADHSASEDEFLEENPSDIASPAKRRKPNTWSAAEVLDWLGY